MAGCSQPSVSLTVLSSQVWRVEQVHSRIPAPPHACFHLFPGSHSGLGQAARYMCVLCTSRLRLCLQVCPTPRITRPLLLSSHSNHCRSCPRGGGVLIQCPSLFFYSCLCFVFFVVFLQDFIKYFQCDTAGGALRSA